jgi:hypothetical protein
MVMNIKFSPLSGSPLKTDGFVPCIFRFINSATNVSTAKPKLEHILGHGEGIAILTIGTLGFK